MNLLVVNHNNEYMLNKLKDSDSVEFVKKVISTQEEKQNPNSIHEVIVNIDGDSVVNLCQFNGTRDNRLIDISIKNFYDNHKKNNINFIKVMTEYAFSSLDAETVTILSNEIDSNILEKLGYESLGYSNGILAYVKDRQIMEEMELVVK